MDYSSRLKVITFLATMYANILRTQSYSAIFVFYQYYDERSTRNLKNERKMCDREGDTHTD